MYACNNHNNNNNKNNNTIILTIILHNKYIYIYIFTHANIPPKYTSHEISPFPSPKRCAQGAPKRGQHAAAQQRQGLGISSLGPFLETCWAGHLGGENQAGTSMFINPNIYIYIYIFIYLIMYIVYIYMYNICLYDIYIYIENMFM